MASCPGCGGKVIKKGSARGRQRWYCRPCHWHGTEPMGGEAAAAQGVDQKQSLEFHRRLRADHRQVRRYVVTAAQNATKVNSAFFASLMAYCKATSAQLIVIPYRYKNPTSRPSAAVLDDDWWASELRPYLLDRRHKLNANLVILADIKTQPTAESPLTGFETITAGESAIIGHPKLELTTVATPHQRLPKVLTTTGAVTEKNYIPSKAGKKAEHHHTFGACVVECQGKVFHMRQLNAKRDGSFMDLQWEYDGPRRRHVARAAGLVMGDTHVRFVDPAVVEATFGPRGMVGTLRPRHLVWNDLNDFHAQSHHDRKNVFSVYVKHHAGKLSVEEELDETFAFVDKMTPRDTVNVIVPSNHSHDFLLRWMNETDPRLDPENCMFWAKTFTAMCDGSRWTAGGEKTPDPFTYWAKRKLASPESCRFPQYEESFRIEGVEVGLHGHQGLNGARGSRKSYGKIGVKTVIGHSHSPGIKDGVYQTGTSTRLRLGYNTGPSSWLQTHCLIYPNGKRTLINIIDGEWRA